MSLFDISAAIETIETWKMLPNELLKANDPTAQSFEGASWLRKRFGCSRPPLRRLQRR